MTGESFDGCLAIAEARALFRMVGAGSTIKELHDLIAVPARTERVLRAYAQRHPEEAHFIETTLKFRSRVLQDFEHLVRGGLPVVDLPETEESHLDGAGETYAVAQR